MTIHAFTQPTGPNPAYINVSERRGSAGDVIVTVRSAGINSAAAIILTRDQALQLAIDIMRNDERVRGASA